mmetsp:Transcript_63926/g.73330  ORF Transcript_63926/g.73330 Transcript_63926/m.73330 type:complete len:85 (+) Transcript_63926:143-397(+)
MPQRRYSDHSQLSLNGRGLPDGMQQALKNSKVPLIRRRKFKSSGRVEDKMSQGRKRKNICSYKQEKARKKGEKIKRWRDTRHLE